MDEAVQPVHEAAGCAVVRRQAIFDERERLTGYELLLDTGRPPASDDEGLGLLAGAFGDIGLRRVVGDHRAYITATSEVLGNAHLLALPADQVVLQLPEQHVDKPLLDTVARLVEDGFKVGVGGWALHGEADALLEHATTIKIDFDFGTLDLTRLVARSEELHARGATLIAGHVQTRGEYEECRRLGFDAFQGHYLAQPDVLAARRTPTARMTALADLLAATGPGAFEELERIICQDAGLAHRFLRLADSALYASRVRVRSVREALARLGAHAVRQWALMTVVAGVSDTSSETARHLLAMGLHRARICQLLARQDRDACADLAFSAGLLSILPALIDVPFDELLSELPLDDRLARALADHVGLEGQMLAAVIAYESGERENADGHPALLAAISRIYSEALLWADYSAGRLS
jgi:EAL and modified HD-GYP domain-containing signal transduction protein